MTRRAPPPPHPAARTPRGARHIARGLLLAAAVAALPAAAVEPTPAAEDPTLVAAVPSMDDVRIGDLVFTRIDVKPFREVASSTGSWTNHVGIVVGRDARGPLVAESTFPLSKTTALSDFVRRSQDGRVAVMRLDLVLDEAAQARLQAAAASRMGVFYDTGFDLHSRRQFCSRFVHEVVREALGVQVGEVRTLAQLFARHPQANLGFWRAWYLGRIPWSRETVTPASLLESPRLTPVFDGRWRTSGEAG